MPVPATGWPKPTLADMVTAPVRSAARECDPDLCKVCASTCHGEAHGTGMECYNMRLRLHQVRAQQ